MTDTEMELKRKVTRMENQIKSMERVINDMSRYIIYLNKEAKLAKYYANLANLRLNECK